MDTRKLTKRISNLNSGALIAFYILDVVLIRLDRLVITHFFKDSKNYVDIMNISAYVVQYLIVVPLCLLVFKVFDPDHDLRIKQHLRKPDVETKTLAGWILMSLGLIYASSYINSFVFVAIQSVSKTQFHTVSFNANPTFLGVLSNILAMSILAPFYEEILFRGALFSNAQRIGTWTAVFAVGISFGLWHGTYSQILYAAVMGTCAAFLVAKTGSLFSSLLLHIIINSIGAVQSIFMGFLDMEKLEETLANNDFSYISQHKGVFIGLIVPAAVVLMLMISGIFFFVREIKYHKDTFSLPEYHTDMTVRGKLGAYMSAPLTVIAVLGALSIAVCSAAGII